MTLRDLTGSGIKRSHVTRERRHVLGRVPFLPGIDHILPPDSGDAEAGELLVGGLDVDQCGAQEVDQLGLDR